jgi:septal ring factor EnvC (AmiA/AmiB activator)
MHNNHRFQTTFVFLFLIFSFQFVHSQDLQKKINQNRKNVQKLKEEIKNYENRIVSEAQKEKNELEKLNDAGQKIGLLQQLLGELEQARGLTEVYIAVLRDQLKTTQGELTVLKKLTGQRLVQVYKHRSEDPLAYVFTSDSWTQAYARLKYAKIIANQDKTDLQTLRKKKNKIVQQKKLIEAELLQQRYIISEKKSEKAALDIELNRRKSSLAKIRKDKRLLNNMLEERKDDLQTLNSLIAELERKKKEQEALERERQNKLKAESAEKKIEYKEPKYVEKSTFNLYKGKLPYPVAGKVIKKFGDQINPVLGTKTRNPGIEIQASQNAAVRAVAKGHVAHIAWLRRMGNTLLIDHGGGYYTVYAHLSEIYVAQEERLNAGDVIASLDENEEGKYVLHFEIYKDQDVQDPSLWLK